MLQQNTNTTFQDLLNSANTHCKTPVTTSTWEGYQSDFRVFEAFCNKFNRKALPASQETAAAYFEWLIKSGKKVDTIQHHKNAIHRIHAQKGLPSPVDNDATRDQFKRLKREHGTPPNKKHALTTSEILSMLEAQSDGLISQRNKAAILIGFTGALRRGEIGRLECQDMEVSKKGLCLTIRQSKTDNAGKGQTVFIPWGKDKATCPIRSLYRWLESSKIKTGPIFRPLVPSAFGHIPAERAMSGSTVARVLKELAAKVGIDPKKIAGLSLRRGFASEAAKQGASLIWIQHHLRHRQASTTEGYIDETSSFGEQNPVRFLAL